MASLKTPGDDRVLIRDEIGIGPCPSGSGVLPKTLTHGGVPLQAGHPPDRT